MTPIRQAATETISIQAPYGQVFDYLSEPRNQEHWAVNFIRDIRETEAGPLATTPFGEALLSCHPNRQAGTLDIQLGDGPALPTRLVPNGDGCTYAFTLFQPVGMPDSVWQEQALPGLREELSILKSLMENPA